MIPPIPPLSCKFPGRARPRLEATKRFAPNLPVSRKFLACARQSAFSLVEVVLAVGVISFAFVAILGLMPAGLAQFRQAMDNSVATQIAQRIILDCQQTDYATLTAGITPPYGQPLVYSSAGGAPRSTRYFDEEGNEVLTQGPTPSGQEMMGTAASGGTPAKPGIIYFVNTRISPGTNLPGSTGAQPGAATGANAYLATVVVQVVFNPSGKALSTPSTGDANSLLVDPTSVPRGTIRTYTAQIGRND